MYCRNCGTQISDNEKFCKNCGCNLVVGSSGTKAPVKKKSGIKPVLGVVSMLAVVVCVTVVIVNVFINHIDKNDTENAGRTNVDVVVNEKEDLAEADVREPQTQEASYSKEDYENAVIMAKAFEGEWYVKKYYDGESWNTYELGKKMLIVAYNFLNDGTITTGGYTYLSGNEKIGPLHRYTYTYVPVETHFYHGRDIGYSCPTIIITEDTIDMSGMDGPVFDISEFRYENINGEDFLINDSCNFALMYDGTYVEYCEPDAYGYYQGFYAFDPFDSLVNSTVQY